MAVQIIDSVAGLADWRKAWEDLVLNATEPNPFLEPFFLLPALENITTLPFKILLVCPESANGDPNRRLIGFLPLASKFRYGGLPVHFLSGATHVHCFVGTPLMRHGYEEQCLQTLLKWFSTLPRREMFVELRDCYLDGTVYQVLQILLKKEGYSWEEIALDPRPYLRVPANLESYDSQLHDHKIGKELRRKRRRCEELGELHVDLLTEKNDLEIWCNTFLDMEASGWKGDAKSALKCSQSELAFFRKVVSNGFAEQRLLFFRLRLGDIPVAMHCCFLCGGTLFLFKIAYDEAYGKISPGMILHYEIIKYAIASGIRAIDSCTDTANRMLGHLLPQHRQRCHLNVETGRTLSHYFTKNILRLRQLSRRFTAGAAGSTCHNSEPK